MIKQVFIWLTKKGQVIRTTISGYDPLEETMANSVVLQDDVVNLVISEYCHLTRCGLTTNDIPGSTQYKTKIEEDKKLGIYFSTN